MITVVSGTARPDSMTLRVARHYHQRLQALSPPGARVGLLSLEGVPVWERGAELLALEAEVLVPTEKFVIVMPEYNGSFPGALKMLMDNSDIKRVWWGKKALLAGVADGRAGNLRGLDHMTNILHYLHVSVFWNKVPISRIGQEVDDSGALRSAATRKTIEEQVAGFLNF